MIFRSLPFLKRYGPWTLSIFFMLFFINCAEILNHKIYSLTPVFVFISFFSMMTLLVRATLLSQEPFIKFLYLIGSSYKQVSVYFHREILYLTYTGTLIGFVFITPFVFIWKIDFFYFYTSAFLTIFMIVLFVFYSKLIISNYLFKIYN